MKSKIYHYWNKNKKGTFQKGHNTPIEIRLKISDSIKEGYNTGKIINGFKGKHHTEETKLNKRLEKLGKPNIKTSETRKRLFREGKLIPPMLNKNHTKETKIKISLNNSYPKPKQSETMKKLYNEGKLNKNIGAKGKDNPSFNNWSSREPYGIEWSPELREQIRQRDHFRCQQCFREQDELRDKYNKKRKLDIHHIDFNKKNNNPNNLISLCHNCHAQTNFNREGWINYFQNRINGGILQ